MGCSIHTRELIFISIFFISHRSLLWQIKLIYWKSGLLSLRLRQSINEPVMRKPVFAICEQQRRRSVCTSTQSDQRLYYSLPRSYNTYVFYIRNFKPLASLCGWAGRVESYLVANPEDRFSRDEVQIRQFQTLRSVHQLRPQVCLWCHFL